MKKCFVGIVLLLLSLFSYSQEKYPQNYFRSPLDIGLVSSGTFGELRSNHFHSGVDFKTLGKTGQNVYAVADGYVSRIKISAYGYGKAIYITHPNGYVSVYGHLDSYNQEIGDFVKKEHYKCESFEMDVFPDSNLLKVKKGQVIGLSGNSGSSGGPHLHFEIRDAKTEYPINPLFFGIKLTDNIKPILSLLKVFPANNESYINNKAEKKSYKLINSVGKYKLNQKDTIELSGKIYFGIQAIDKLNGAANKNGIYSIELLIDSVTYFYFDVETFGFHENRYLNSLIDYEEYIKSGNRIYKCYIQPNNKLSCYKNMKDNGVFEFTDNKIHNVQIKVKDFKGNTSELNFPVKSIHREFPAKVDFNFNGNVKTCFEYSEENVYENENLKFVLPKDALYDKVFFEYKTSTQIRGTYSKIYHLHNEFTPIHKSCDLSIKADSVIPEKLQTKLLIARKNAKGFFVSAGGKWEDGYVKTKIKNFGDYTIVADTIAPKIKAIDIYSNKNVSAQKNISFKISDDFSGIKSYRGTMNEKWILMDYDAKRSLLTYTIDEKMLKGKNTFKLEVKDAKDNIATYSTTLIR
ncbi:MAG: M23 family metallopeptidase [Saprospiraceae bacterium]|nr:M23 family metallopeptidase [Saprospiraceae bacterium]